MAGKHELRFLFFEGLMVVFSVLAALLVDEWRQDVQVRHQVEIARSALDSEVRHNLRELITLDSVASARRDRLQALKPAASPGQSLSALTGRFGGYRTTDLASAAWVRLSTGALADHLPQEYVTDAFDLYAWNTALAGLNDQVKRLVYGEVFYDPVRTGVAKAISLAIMDQQIAWAEQARPKFEQFLEKYGTPATAAVTLTPDTTAVPDTIR